MSLFFFASSSFGASFLAMSRRGGPGGPPPGKPISLLPKLTSISSGCLPTSPKFAFDGSESWIRWSQACHSQTTSPLVLPVGLTSTIESASHGPRTVSGLRPAAIVSAPVLISQTISRTLPFGSRQMSW